MARLEVVEGTSELAKAIAIKQIIGLLKNNNFVVIDDHVKDSVFKSPCKNEKRKIAGVGINKTADGNIKSVVALIKGVSYYSTNSLYIGEDSMVHLSRMSSGPTVVGDDIQKANDSLFFGGGISKAIWADCSETKYNLGTDKNKDA